jgi:hypothetical protein
MGLDLRLCLACNQDCGSDRNFMFCSAGCSLLRDEGFFCNLDVLYGGRGIGKLYFFSSNFFQFLVIKTLDLDWIRIRIGTS